MRVSVTVVGNPAAQRDRSRGATQTRCASLARVCLRARMGGGVLPRESHGPPTAVGVNGFGGFGAERRVEFASKLLQVGSVGPTAPG
jgi:hypothetical protein